MNDVTSAWILFGVIGGVCGVLLELIILFVRIALAKTKPWAVLLDEEGGIDFLGRAKMVNGSLVVGKGDNKKQYPVKRESRRITNNGLAYVLGRQTGVNLVVPDKDEIKATLNDREKVHFEICDPLLMARVMDKRVTQETLEGQRDQEDWKSKAIIPLAIVLGVAFVAIVAVVGFMG